MQARPRIAPIVQLLLLLAGAILVFILVSRLPALRDGRAGTALTPVATLLPSTPTPLRAARDDVALVHSRVVLALQEDDVAALFNEHAPEARGAAGFYGQLIQGIDDLFAGGGPVTDVVLAGPPLFKAGADTAVAEVQVIREHGTNHYRIHYRLIQGEWWVEKFAPLPDDQP